MSDSLGNIAAHNTNGGEKSSKVEFSQSDLRCAIGFLSFTFPFILLIGGAILFGTPIQDSLSSYYHTPMRDVFVGILFALGILLFAYKGYGKVDAVLGDIGFVCAIGIALFPTIHDFPDVAQVNAHVAMAHNIFAILLFSILAFFSIFLFTKTHPGQVPSPEKRLRNKIFVFSGVVIVACIVGIVTFVLFLPESVKQPISPFKPIFWLEAIANIAFGVSWYVKGEGIIKDKA